MLSWQDHLDFNGEEQQDDPSCSLPSKDRTSPDEGVTKFLNLQILELREQRAALTQRVESLERERDEAVLDAKLWRREASTGLAKRDSFRMALEKIRDYGEGRVFTAAGAGILAAVKQIARSALGSDCPACTRGEYPHRNCFLR